MTSLLGIIAKRFTYMAINDLYCSITAHLDNKLHALGIFLDLSKAFDTLNHNILLHKLNIYCIRGLANTWIENYLSDRKQYVTYDQKYPKKEIKCVAYHKAESLGLYCFYSTLIPLISKFSFYDFC